MDTRHHTPHNTTHTHHTTTQDNNTTATPHGDRDRERKQGQREKRRRKRSDKTGQKKTRQEKREDSFSVWWCMAVFCWCSDFLVNSVCARVLSLLNSVKYDSSLISFSAPWQVNSFFNICEIFILCSYSLHFFGYAVTVLKNFRITGCFVG